MRVVLASVLSLTERKLARREPAGVTCWASGLAVSLACVDERGFATCPHCDARVGTQPAGPALRARVIDAHPPGVPKGEIGA